MKFLQKMLIVVMISVSAGNVDVSGMLAVPPAPPAPPVLPAPIAGTPRLDFNSIITFGTNVQSSLQPKTHAVQLAGALNTRCVYFSITPAGGVVANVNFGVPLHQQPNINDHNIYFPADGHQPTTPEAVQWSCANIDNRENSPITEWYMQMFGVISLPAAPGGGAPAVFVQAGWTNPIPAPPAAQRIITFHANVDNTMVNDPDAAPGAPQITRQQLFIQNFRKIASNPVGRVLLYRILIEIRRRAVDGNGTCENNNNLELFQHLGVNFTQLAAVNPNFFNKRNECRSLKVLWRQNDFSFIRTGILNFNNIVINKQIISGQLRNTNTVLIKTQQSILTDDLFHELLHWYHYLREPYRFAMDLNIRGTLGINQRIGATYYPWANAIPNVLGNRLAAVAWYGKHVTSVHSVHSVLFEEIRTILGSHIGINSYLEGDDLSENVFMLCRELLQNLPLQIRFGHKNFTYVENIVSAQQALLSASLALNNYIPNTNSPQLQVIQPLQPNVFPITGSQGTQYPEEANRVASLIVP